MEEKRKIHLSEEKLECAITEAFAEIIDGINPFESSMKPNSSAMLVEMSQINVDERQIFPFDGFDVQVWSTDHEPPHFHVIRDGWDVEFLIDNGELYRIKRKGKKEQVLSDMIHNVKEWLKRESVVNTGKTNQENAWIAWKQNHPR